MSNNPKCRYCNDTGWISIRTRDGAYAFAGAVPDDTKGFSDADCWYCDSGRPINITETNMPSVEHRLKYWRERAIEAENKLINFRLAARPALNYLENTESEFGITLTFTDKLRALIEREGLEREAKTDNTFLSLVNEGLVEAEKAMKKFPQPNYVISKIAEEAGEVVKSAIHCAEGRETPENVRGEMRQLIAMLYRLWVEGDQVHGLAAIRSLASEVQG